jgi:hypothetical protein
MRTLETTIICAALLAIACAGCGTTSKEIQSKSQSERTDVFTEIRPGEPIREGFGNLLIKVNIKTPRAGYYILESKQSLHGKTEYPFLVSIDGQAALWKVEGTRDIKRVYDKDGKTSHDPEAGEGIKYRLEKEIRLRAGTHKVFLGLPEDNYSIEVEITLKDGENAILSYEPIYNYLTHPTRIPTFLRGITKYEVFFDGKKIVEKNLQRQT